MFWPKTRRTTLGDAARLDQVNASSASRELDHPKRCCEAVPPVVPLVRRSRHGFGCPCYRRSGRTGEFRSVRGSRGLASMAQRADFAARWKQAGHRSSRLPQALLGGSHSFDSTSARSGPRRWAGSRPDDESGSSLEKLAPLIGRRCPPVLQTVTATAVPFGFRYCRHDRRGVIAQLVVNSPANCRSIGRNGSINVL